MKLTDYQTNHYIKMLLIGKSGSGKTGALASLALAGYKLRILDYDKGLEPLYQAIKKSGDMSALDNIEFVSLSDAMHTLAGVVVPKGVPQAFQTGLKLLDKWEPKVHADASELGKPEEWGADCILVIDSLTHLSNAALRYIKALNSTSDKNVTQPEWGTAQRAVEGLLTRIYSSDFKTNVIMTAHIAYIQGKEKLDEDGEAAGALSGEPMSLGRSLPPKIPGYFNTMLVAHTQGVGQFTKRLISTVPDGVINTKSPILDGIPKELPIETGLASYFDVALGKAESAMPPAKSK